MTTGEDLSATLAVYSLDARFEDISSTCVETAKKSLLDLLGVMLAAGGVEPIARSFVDIVREAGGRGEASVIGFPDRVPAEAAAFANGAMAHCLDFDDLTPWGAHASSSVIPAALAIAERRGGVTGRELLAAIAIGQDIFARMRCHTEWRKEWNISPIFGVFAATAAAGRLLGLSKERLVNAIAIASMQPGGTMDAAYGVGGDLRSIYAAFSAKTAVNALLLAERGVAGTKTSLSGEHGFFAIFFGSRYDLAGIRKDLGRDFQGASTLYKPWPAVGPAHSHIHATIGLATEHDLRPDDIAEIRVRIGDYHELMCTPLADRQAPSSLVDAKFSLPFLVAVAAVHRNVAIAHFIGDALRDPTVLDVARRIVPVRDPAFDWDFELPAGRVEIVMLDGRTMARTGENVPGSAAAPLGWDDIVRKFTDCARVAATPPSQGRVEALIEGVRTLEEMEDVRALTNLLAPR